MANNFDSNITQVLARVFLEKFESARILSKNVNTQLLDGKFNPSSGDTVNFKRPTDYTTTRTSDGDVSGGTADSIITGKAKGVVQDYFTVEVDFFEADEAIKMDQLDELLAPMATRIVTDLELDFANFMMINSGLFAGTIGQGVATWEEVASAPAMMKAAGVPQDQPWFYAVNPFTEKALASNQRSLGSGGSSGELIKTAHERSSLSKNFAGMDIMTATTLASYTTGAGADRSGLINGTPVVTYLAAKDTMTISIPVDAFDASLPVVAGDRVRIAATNLLNLSTRQVILDAAGATVLWTGTVTADVTMSSGAGTLVVTGPAIFEAAGAYNTVSRVIADGNVVTILGAASTTYQPNLFWHKQAFGIGSVPIKKLFSTDTVATTEDGLQIRISKGASIRENKQIVRFDLRPAFATLNPFFAGHGWGDA